jgi:alpha-amylase
MDWNWIPRRYHSLIDAFRTTLGNTSNLIEQITRVKSACLASGLLGTFSENHDNPRFANYNPDISLAKNVIAFTILADGIPIIYYGQEQHYAGGNDTDNREALWLVWIQYCSAALAARVPRSINSTIRLQADITNT